MQRAPAHPGNSHRPPSRAAGVLLLCLAKVAGRQVGLFDRPAQSAASGAAPAATPAAPVVTRLTADQRKELLDEARALLRRMDAPHEHLQRVHDAMPSDSEKTRQAKLSLAERLQRAGAGATPAEVAPPPAPAVAVAPAPPAPPPGPAPAPAEGPPGPWNDTGAAYAARHGAPLPGPPLSAAARAAMTARARAEHDRARTDAYASHDAKVKEWRDLVAAALANGTIHLDTPGLSVTHDQDMGARNIAIMHALARVRTIGGEVAHALFDANAAHTWRPGDVAYRHDRGQGAPPVKVIGQGPKGVEVEGPDGLRVHLHPTGLLPMSLAQYSQAIAEETDARLRREGLPPASVVRDLHERAFPESDPRHLRMGPGSQRPEGPGWMVIPGTRRGGWHRRKPSGGWERWYPDRGLVHAEGPATPSPEALLERAAQGPAAPGRPGSPRKTKEGASGASDGSARRTHHDVGEVVSGARKHDWAQINAANLQEVEAEGSAAAARVVVKAAVLGEASSLIDRDQGSTAGAASLKAYIRSVIAGKPAEDGEAARSAYVHGVGWVAEALSQCSTVTEVRGFLDDFAWLARPGRDYDEERPVNDQELMDLAKRYPPAGRFDHTATIPLREQPEVDHDPAAGPRRVTPMVRINLTAMAADGQVFGPGMRSVRRVGAVASPYAEWAQVMGPKMEALLGLTPRTRAQQSRLRDELREADRREATKDWAGLVEAPKAPEPASSTMAGSAEVGPEKKLTYYEIMRLRRQGPMARVGGEPIPSAVTGADLASTFGLRAVQYGNWIDDDEAQTHLNSCYGAFRDLATVLQLRPEAIAQHGKLAIAFGARGKGNAAAHYEPVKAVINLTSTRGGGTLAHEWAHFLDHQLGGDLRELPKAGQTVYLTSWLDAHPETAVRDALRDLLTTMRGPEQLEVEGHRLQTWGRSLKQRRKAGGGGPGLSAELGRFNAAVTDYNRRVRSRVKPPPPTKFYLESARLGATETSTNEMFARAFEAYVEDKLVGMGRMNTYLVMGTREGAIEERPDPYPAGEERAAINKAFDRLLTVLRETGAMAKALQRSVVSPLTAALMGLAKVTGHQAPLMAPRQGLALVPASSNPSIRRWQRMSPEEAERQGHPTLRGIMATAQRHLARLPADAHLGGGLYAGALQGPLNTLKGYAAHAEQAHERPAGPNGELNFAQRRASGMALDAAVKLHALNEKADNYRPAPSEAQIADMSEPRLADTLIASRRLQTADSKDPWALAGQRALEALRTRTATHPQQDTPAARLVRTTAQALDVLDALPKSIHLPAHGHSAGAVAGHLRDVEAHAHKLVWNPGMGASYAPRSEAKLAEVQRIMAEARELRRAPARMDLITQPTADLFALVNDADALRNPAGGDEWTEAQNQARVEIAMREGPDAQAIEARRKTLESRSDPEGDMDSYHTKQSRGMVRPDAILELATRREVLRRQLLQRGEVEAVRRMFGAASTSANAGPSSAEARTGREAA